MASSYVATLPVINHIVRLIRKSYLPQVEQTFGQEND